MLPDWLQRLADAANMHGNISEARAFHDRLKADDSRWKALKYLGIQESGVVEGPDLELRNCACGSTLARAIVSARK